MSKAYINDITLMAYADSELSEEENKEIEIALKDDEVAQSRLKSFIITGVAISVYEQILTWDHNNKGGCSSLNIEKEIQ